MKIGVRLGLRIFHPENYALSLTPHASRIEFNDSIICFRRGVIVNRLDLVSRILYSVDAIPIVRCLNDRKSDVPFREEFTGYRIYEKNISLVPSRSVDMKRSLVSHTKLKDSAMALSEYFAQIIESLSRVYSFFFSSPKYKLTLLMVQKKGALAASKGVVKKPLEILRIVGNTVDCLFVWLNIQSFFPATGRFLP